MQNKKKFNKKVISVVDELRELGLEAYETTTETMLEEMGASIGASGCCSVIVQVK